LLLPFPRDLFAVLLVLPLADMPGKMPSDSAIQGYIQKRVRGEEDISLLTRKVLKDGIAEKFKLSSEQRTNLDTDDGLKKSIKAWIKEAIVRTLTGISKTVLSNKFVADILTLCL
jgi:hypothetical protein